MNLSAAAQTLRAAKQDYLNAFRQYFAREVQILPDERFWQLHAVFRKEVLTFCFAYRRTNGVEQAARELFRKPLAEDFAGGARYSLLEAVQFAKTWRQLSRRLAQPLYDVVQDRSDDGYDDLLDALPLAGQTVFQSALRQEFRSHDQFEQAVRQACCHSDLAELILRGENYVSMSLEDAAQEYVLQAPPE